MIVPKIIALHGQPGSGKSEVRKVLETLGYTPRRVAAPIKAMCRAIGMKDEHIEGALKRMPYAPLGIITPTKFMQVLGRELPDALGDPELYARLWARTVMDDELEKVVVEDHRYAYEANWFYAIGVTEIWNVDRLNHEPDTQAMKHVAENQMLDSDDTVFNSGSLDDLRTTVTRMEKSFSDRYPA